MDLSKLLGDLYQRDEVDAPVDDSSTETAPAASAAGASTPSVSYPLAAAPVPDSPPDAGPSWADEALLDEAFASWTPGPPDDAPALEREMANGFPATSFPELEGELSSGDLSTVERSAPGPIHDDVHDDVESHEDTGDPIEAVPPRMWTRADDDVLPRRRSGGRRGLRLSLRRR